VIPAIYQGEGDVTGLGLVTGAFGLGITFPVLGSIISAPLAISLAYFFAETSVLHAINSVPSKPAHLAFVAVILFP
jgi:hypothetical protein